VDYCLRLGSALLPGFAFAQPQQTPPPEPQTSPAAPPTSAESSNKKKSSSRHQHDFLIKGTVFHSGRTQLRGSANSDSKKRGQILSLARRCQFPWRICDSRGCKARGMKLWWTPGVARNKKARGHDRNERIEDVVFHMEREGAKPS